MSESCCKNCICTRRAFLAGSAGLALTALGCNALRKPKEDNMNDKKTPMANESRETDDLRFITYCGLYCGLCADRSRIPKQANALRETMANEGYDKWGTEMSGFTEFWKFLTDYCDADKVCPGCRQGGGARFCSIKKCAVERKKEICVFCEEYPCKHVLALAQGYVTLLADGKRMKEIGIPAWVQEQKERAKTGFAYADIRCPYNVPSE